MINTAIAQLVQYALQHRLIQPEDTVYSRNRLLELLHLPSYTQPREIPAAQLETILAALCVYAVEQGVLANSPTARELYETALMGALTPRPSQVISEFWQQYAISPQAATDNYYAFSQHTNYIRTYRTKLDVRWNYHSGYGPMEITINLAKPEKDPRDIQAAQRLPKTGYPLCPLCVETEGYAGRADHPARQNHRIIPLELHGEDWALQYSPYVYYPEHCIVLRQQHVPMGVHVGVFRNLLAFLEQFPHYFIGANAGLPIVGGSILSHDHFQGGRHTFPMERAGLDARIAFAGHAGVSAGIVRWPMAALRLTCAETAPLLALAEYLMERWMHYSDPSVGILARTADTPHNAITPIARMRGGMYELDLVLRNNLATATYPMGVFHPHPELHHIKKENIGLIEVMGLAVLPARLKQELSLVQAAVLAGEDLHRDERTALHANWADGWRHRPDCNADTIESIIKDEVGRVFQRCLEDASVFKRDAQGQAALRNFIAVCGGQELPAAE